MNLGDITSKPKEDKEKEEKLFNKFDYIQTFGESMNSKSTPEMFILDISNLNLSKVDIKKIDISSLRERIDKEEKLYVHPGFPLFDINDDIVFIGYHLQFKLGLRSCHKRRSSIYLCKEIEKDKFEFTNLTKDSYCSLYPKLFKSKKFIYFSNEKSFPHMNGYQLRQVTYNDIDNIKDELLLDKEKENSPYFNTIYSCSIS